jgi:diaminopimelate epimerase
MNADELPPITEINVLHLEPNDTLVVHVEQQITQQMAHDIKALVADTVGIDVDRVLLVSGPISLTVIET